MNIKEIKELWLINNSKTSFAQHFQLTKAFAGFSDGLDVGYDIKILVGHNGGLREQKAFVVMKS